MRGKKTSANMNADRYLAMVQEYFPAWKKEEVPMAWQDKDPASQRFRRFPTAATHSESGGGRRLQDSDPAHEVLSRA